MNYKETLYRLQDVNYQAFQKRIIPNDETIIGVRTHELRKLAKQLLKQYGIEALSLLREDTYEERLMMGMIIANAKLSFDQRLPYIKQQVKRINNWALCDLFCGELKQVKEHRVEMLEHLQPYFSSKEEYDVRFGIVMLLSYYCDSEYCDFAFSTFASINNDAYYVKMAIAWAISMYYIRCKEQTLVYLRDNQLDDFTHRKAIQKIIESRQVSAQEKQILRQLKNRA